MEAFSTLRYIGESFFFYSFFGTNNKGNCLSVSKYIKKLECNPFQFRTKVRGH